MNIALVLGTARAERKSEFVATALQAKLTAAGHTVTLVDVREHVTAPVTIPAWGPGGANEMATAWHEIASAAEVFIHVLPEYNHGYPGEWKLLVDSLDYKDYSNKTTYLVGVSAGPFGGSRVVEHVQPVLWELGLKLSTDVLYISGAGKAFAEDGSLTDAVTETRIDEFVAKI